MRDTIRGTRAASCFSGPAQSDNLVFGMVTVNFYVATAIIVASIMLSYFNVIDFGDKMLRDRRAVATKRAGLYWR